MGNFPLELTNRNTQSRQFIKNSAAKEGVELDVRLELESPVTLRQFLLSGLIHAFVPYSPNFREVQANRLEAIPIKGLIMKRHLARNRESPNPAAKGAPEESVVDEMRNLRRADRRRSNDSNSDHHVPTTEQAALSLTRTDAKRTSRQGERSSR